MKKSRFSLKSTQSFLKINRALTNRSLSKQTHSFSKSPRFSLPKPTCQQHYYAGEQIKSKRSGAGIGYSYKFDFTKDLTCSPGSSRYMIKSEIEDRTQKKKGFFMGLGRQKLVTGSYINRELCRTPSSDKYKISLINKPQSPKFSMRPKTKMINKTLTLQPQNSNPGPGDYNNPQLNYSSRCSKFSNISYGTSKTQRFITQKAKAPGPGTYKQVSKLSNVGRYVISSDQGGTGAKFEISRRVTELDEIVKKSKKVPGVGSYQMPSQFGQYDADMY